jgi:uncharacterized protein YbjT (DUF2867 family)
MILVAGSTGMVGFEICRLLAEKGKSIKAVVRTTSDPAKVDRLKAIGAQLVPCDLCNPDTLKEACKDVEAVISTVSAMPFSYQPGVNDIQTVDLDGVTSLIDAAKAAGVKHFIDISFSRNLDTNFPLRNAKRAVEKHLMDSGMIYTILRPSCFMEVWLGPAVGFDPVNGKITVYGSGDQLVGWISFRDVAAFAVESLTNPAARNKVIELGGETSLSYHQVIKIFEEVGKRKYEVTYVPKEALHQQVLGAQDPMQMSFAGLMECVAVGDPVDMTATLKQFPLKLVSVQDHAKSVMG